MTLPKTPSFRLDGKRALVAGASSGIGLAPASAKAAAQANPIPDEAPAIRARFPSSLKEGVVGSVIEILRSGGEQTPEPELC